ncbi:MAG: type I-E CRISPR-associated protein Cas7/Cse4/CasC [Proteobacteria bacterium]|nr:MAG: type I-E CRISPR-associated protein Cas7/Cse4/CasC [Pseudomonadota bacterium]
MSQFIQLHLLTAYSPSNLNRDDLGRPKTAIVGNTERLRISSQSLKRAWRTSKIFEEALGEYKGKRTKRLGKLFYDYLLNKGITEKQAEGWVETVIKHFGSIDKSADKKIYTAQLVHVAPEEEQAVYELLDKLIVENRAPENKELESLLRKNAKAVDIALFGRMLADSPSKNVEAAVQVAHAFSVNSVKIEDDFFTAVDDLNKHDIDAGAGHMGDSGFGSGIFYQYICINKTQLIENLVDEGLANKAIKALVEAAAKVAPTGKQNSFASRAYTSCLLAEKGSQQPRSLAVAYFKAIKDSDPVKAAIGVLKKQRDYFEKAYGACAETYLLMDVHDDTANVSLDDILHFVAE